MAQPRAIDVGSCAFSCKVFAPVALESFSHVVRPSSSKASATRFNFFYLLMFSVFLVLGHCLCSHNHYVND